MRFFQQSEVRKAIACFDQVLDIDPTSCDASMYRG
jgi:hypothetical protein